jgi:hypothetical protein
VKNEKGSRRKAMAYFLQYYHGIKENRQITRHPNKRKNYKEYIENSAI